MKLYYPNYNLNCFNYIFLNNHVPAKVQITSETNENNYFFSILLAKLQTSLWIFIREVNENQKEVLSFAYIGSMKPRKAPNTV